MKTKLFFLSICLSLFSNTIYSQCNYQLRMIDSFGDGWNGADMDVLVNGVVVLDDVTFTSGSEAFENILVNTGDNITTIYGAAGSYPGETSYEILDFNGVVVGSGDDSDITTPIVSTCPSCVDPLAVSNTAVTGSSADFSWTDSSTEDGGYNWEVVPAGSGQGAGVVASGTTAANAVMVSATGLSSGTGYDFYIQSNCGGSTSNWSAPVSFTTDAACGDTLSSLCYSQTSTIEVLASFSASSGDWAEIVFNSGGTEACCDELLVYDGLNGTGNLIYGALSGGGIADVSTIGSVVSTTGNISLAINSDGSVTCASSTNVDPISITLNCVTPPSCIEPDTISNTAVTTTTADFSWTDSATEDAGYNWEVVPAGSGQGLGVVASGTTAADAVMVSATGLTSATNYDFYIQSNCGGDTSSWSSAISFITSCDSVTDFTENFDAVSTPDLPLCWSSIVIENATGTDPAVGTSTSADSSAPNGVRLYNGSGSVTTPNDVILISPLLNSLQAQTHRLRFFGERTSDSSVEVGTITDPADPSTFTMFQAVTLTTTHTEYTVNFDTYLGSDTYIAFRHPNTSTFDSIYLDDIIWEVIPSCVAPSSLTVSNVVATSADLSWASGGSGETSWELEYGAAGFTQGTAAGTVIPANSNPFTLTGLSSGTFYDVYVRAVCSPSDSSEWSIVESFSTTPDYCAGDLVTDSGGQMGDYSNNENITYTICPDNAGDSVVVTFTEFSFENSFSGCWDGLTIYDGDVATGTVIPSPGGSTDEWCWDRDDATPGGTGDLLGVSIAGTTASGCVTIVLSSDSGVTREGFAASVSCESTVYMWDGTAWSNTPEGSITINDNMYVNGTGAVLSNAVSAENVYVSLGASLDASAGDITVMGDLANDGDITGSDQVILEGTSATLSGTGTMSNLTIGASGSATVNGSQMVSGTLDVMSGGNLDAGGAITLVSNAMGTARVDEVDAGAITGDVNVERYIPGTNRSFRFLGSSVTGPNVFDSWQEAGANAAGLGIQVTGVVGTVGTNNAATGLDETLTGNPSLFKWNNNQSWDAVTNTKTEVLNAGDFYRVFVRGDRTTDLSGNASAATATTLRATGSLFTGPYGVSPSVASGEFFAVANPYQSKIDMGLVAPANVATDMYYWDPSIGPNGDYTNINIATGTGTAGAATNVLDAGQAVFFSSTGSSSVNIEESDKVIGTANAAVFSAPVVNQLLRVKLYQTSRYQNGQTESDGMYIHFDNTFSDAVNFNDAIKWNGLNTNIAIDKSTGDKLSVERRSLPTVNESVPLHLSNHLATDYTMIVELDALPGLDVFVKDNLSNTLTPVANNGTTAVNFIVDANNAASIDANRFEIVFQTVTLGLNDEDALSAVRLYPNPVTGDEIQLDLGSIDSSNDISVAIYNTLGQQVRTYNYDSGVSNVLTVNKLETLSNGVYILTLTNGDATITRRFVKK